MAAFRRLLLGLMLVFAGALVTPSPSIEPHSPIDIVVDTLAPQAQAITSSQRALLRRGVSPIASWDASTGTPTSLAALVTATRTSNAMMFDSAGKLTFAPSNILLNSATLSTQTVTVQSGVSYILSAKGTGAITLSGASTSVWTGTGASNRVDLKITASTSSLTLTVAGSVTAARLSAVTYETSFRSVDDVDTTSAAYYGPRIDYTYPSTPGLLVEGSFAELLLQTGFASGWTTTRATLAGGVTTGVDGTTSAATLIEDATASNTHVTAQSITFASGSSYVFSAVAKAKGRNWVALRFPSSAFGSSITASFDLSNGVVGTVTSGTSGIISLGSGWYRCWLIASATASVSASPQIYLENADNSITYTGDGTSGIYVSDANTGVGTAISSIIKATSTSVTRAADALAAAAYSSNPAIIQYRAQSTGARARKKLTTFSSISSETAEWIEAIRVYPVGTSSAYLDAHLTVDGAW